MLTDITHYYQKALATCAILVCGLSICMFSCAEGLSTIYHEQETIQLTPISMMDDDTLYLSAELERDCPITKRRRLSNHRWLSTYRKQKHTGVYAIRKLLKNTASALLPHLYRRKQNTRAEEHERSFFTNLNNYHIELNNNGLQLGMNYRF